MFFPSRPFLNSLKIIPLVECLLVGALMLMPVSPGSTRVAAGERSPLRVLIVTGGHDFERPPFFAMFQAMPGIQWTEAVQPSANDLWILDEARKYDVIVLYDFVQEISEGQKRNMVRLLKEEGKGLVGLHHCIGDYQDWPEFRQILGGRYYLSRLSEEGIEYQQVSFFTTKG